MVSNERTISDQSFVEIEIIATACEEPARNWDRGQKIGIFHSNPLRPPYNPHTKSPQNSLKHQFLIFHKDFLKIFRL
jgi:hypothetical protein